MDDKEELLRLIAAHGEACGRAGYFVDPDSALHLKAREEADRLSQEIKDLLDSVSLVDERREE